MIELGVYSVLYSWLSRHRIVLLKEMQGERFLPIWIGQFEAEAIAIRLQGPTMPRPLTHDLLKNMIEELDGVVRYVVVNDLNNNTFYAGIAVDHDGEVQLVDSRPSDAIALAVRVSVPIYAEESVLDKAGIERAPDIRGTSAEGAENLDVFRDFVDSLDLDDLGN
ncbi:MAG: bifunctional nuclease family protein [Anaerolineae bacterium]|nr:bifunctional nuclease family protein [Anaerolineae bacterium]